MLFKCHKKPKTLAIFSKNTITQILRNIFNHSSVYNRSKTSKINDHKNANISAASIEAFDAAHAITYSKSITYFHIVFKLQHFYF